MLTHSCQVRKAWTPELKGTCVDQQTIINSGIAHSTFHLALDWLYALLPIPLFWNLQMSTKLKLSVILIFSLGIL